MILWTIQDYKVYESMLDTGVLTASYDRVFYDDVQLEAFQPGYNWMVEQMKKRGMIQPAGAEYPIWAWYQWSGKRKRIDMRSHLGRTDSKVVQLTIDLEEKDVLLSDYNTFHSVLNYWYLPCTEKDDQDFDNEYKTLGYKWGDWCKKEIQTPEMSAIRAKIRDSWERIFDTEREDDGYIYGLNSKKCIQATFWQLRIDQVIKAEVYPIKSRKIA